MIDFGTEELARHRIPMDEAQTPRRRFDILSLSDLANLPDPAWLIDGVIPKGGIVEMHGMPAAGKSFLALDIALHVATGTSWHGHSTEQGSVLYVAAEGATGYKRRVDAWKTAHGIDDIDSLYFIASGVQLHEDHEVEGLLDSLNDVNVPASLVIFDTLARCFVGADENSSTAMGLLLEGAAKIGAELDATVLLVHHTRKDGSTERGSIALRGGVDSMMAVESNRDKLVTVTSLKMKNAADFDQKYFRLAEVGPSCVMEPIHVARPLKSLKKERKTSADYCLDLLPDEGATHAQWLSLVLDAEACSKATFNRSLGTLVSNAIVELGEDDVYRAIRG